MTIVVGGASGDLGQRVVDELLKLVPANELILLSRNPDSLAARQAAGMTVRQADYDDIDSVTTALDGGDIFLVISTLSIGRRSEQHGNAFEAARKAGIQHVVYTSSGGVQAITPSISGQEHYASEEMLRNSGMNYTILRNGWYANVVADMIIPAGMEFGAIASHAGDGVVAPVAKQDCARAAAYVLANAEKHAGNVYEITGPELFSHTDFAKIASELSGKEVKFQDLTIEESQAMFDAMGVNREYEEGMISEQGHAWASDEMVTYQQAIRGNYFSICSHHVKLITGTEAQPLASLLPTG